MKLRLATIPPVGGLDLSFDLSPELFTVPAHARQRPDQAFEKPVHCEAHVDLSGNDVFFNGNIVTTLSCLCSRCGENFDYPLSLNVFLTCTPRRGGLSGRRNRFQHGDYHEDSDEGLIYFENNELELDEIVKEQIYLNLPIRYRCATCTKQAETEDLSEDIDPSDN